MFLVGGEAGIDEIVVIPVLTHESDEAHTSISERVTRLRERLIGLVASFVEQAPMRVV